MLMSLWFTSFALPAVPTDTSDAGLQTHIHAHAQAQALGDLHVSTLLKSRPYSVMSKGHERP